MIINTDSWHYKWWSWTYKVWRSDVPHTSNLCRYVQRLFWMTLITILFYGIVAFVVGTALTGVVVGVWHHPIIALIVVGAVAVVIASMAGLFFYLDSGTKEVVDAWVEAKTKGICPLIEFEDDDK